MQVYGPPEILVRKAGALIVHAVTARDYKKAVQSRLMVNNRVVPAAIDHRKLGRAADVSWLSARRRRVIARRPSPRQWRLTGKFRGEADRQLLAACHLRFRALPR